MVMRIFIVGLLLSIGFAVGFSQMVVPSSDLTLIHARLIDGTGAVHENVRINIVDGRIDSITPMEQIRLLASTDPSISEYPSQHNFYFGSGRIIDVRGKTVIPGLIDAHLRLFDSGAVSDASTMEYDLLTGLPERLNALLENGVTTVKSVADPIYSLSSIRDALNRDHMRGPRFFTSGPAIVEGLPPYALTLETPGDWFARRTLRPVKTPDEAAYTVDLLADGGVDGLHVVSRDPSLEIDYHNPFHHFPEAVWLEDPIAAAVVKTGQAYNLPVSVHTDGEEMAIHLAEMGIRGLEHSIVQTRLRDDRLSSRLVSRGIAYVPTLSRYTGSSQVERENTAANLRYLAQQGVRIVLGSDTAGSMPYGRQTVREAELMVQAGLSPTDVLRAATTAAAEYLGIADEVGTVESGEIADLIILEKDPHKDITALRTILMVIKNGRVVVDKKS